MHGDSARRRGCESELSMEAAEYEYNEEGAFSFVSELPKVMPPEGETELVKWKGFWVMPEIIKAVMGIETQFEPLPSDIILISFPKTGTTWLKALTVTLLNHHNSKQNPSLQTDDPLLTKTPHQLVPFLELQCFGDNPTFDINTMTSPRVFNTHLPYSMLPDCIKNSGCRLVYITRNPMDTFVSHWHFYYKRLNKETTMDEAFEHFCQGFIRRGPYFEHVLDYWKVSNEKEGILYLTYEELKVDPYKHVKRLADFLAFSLDQADIQRVVSKCSFDRLSNLDVNKGASNIQWADWDSSAYFRRGVIGDAVNYLTPDKVAQLKKMAEEKWAGSGLTLCSAELFMTV